MQALSRLFLAVTSFLPSQREREISYLAASSDIAELERRMRELDRPHSLLPLGLGLR